MLLLAENNRKYIGIESNNRYYNIAMERLGLKLEDGMDYFKIDQNMEPEIK
jgi:DNA modification methylase